MNQNVKMNLIPCFELLAKALLNVKMERTGQCGCVELSEPREPNMCSIGQLDE